MINRRDKRMTNRVNKQRRYQTNRWVRLTIRREKKTSRIKKERLKEKMTLM